jgi:hypothetical protein
MRWSNPEEWLRWRLAGKSKEEVIEELVGRVDILEVFVLEMRADGYFEEEKEYNGWTNWVTWNVSLWFNNDEPMYRAMRRMVEVRGEELSARDCEAFVRYTLPGGTPDMKQNNVTYDKVNWQEIADAWRDDGTS